MADPADPNGRARTVTKSPTAYRTISEVSEELNVPQHVLRFWETRFGQVRPLKRGGGRRYYRPEDVGLLRRIQKLLYQEGYTIKGVQKLLREGRAAAAAACLCMALPATGETLTDAFVHFVGGEEAATVRSGLDVGVPSEGAATRDADGGSGGESP